MPAFRPVASEDPAAWPDSAVALHMAHWADAQVLQTREAKKKVILLLIGGSMGP